MTRDQELAAQMRLKFLPVAASLVALAAALAAPAASALDDLGQSDSTIPTKFSFSGSTAGSTNWDSNAPAAPGNDYRVATSGFIIRGAAGADNTTVKFQGDSLTLLDNTTFQMRGGRTGVTFDVNKLIVGDGTNASTATALVAAAATTYTLAASTNIELLTNGTLKLDAGGSGRAMIVSAPITGNGNLSVATLDTSVGAGVTTLTNTGNVYNGNTTVTGTGVLLMGALDALPHATTDGDLIVSANTIVLPPVNPGSPGGIFRLNNFDTTIQGLADGVGGGTVENGGASLKTLTIQGNSAGDRTFSGIIQDGSGGGALALTKTGSGTREILTGVNTYTGDTTISGGQLRISGSGTLGNNSAVTISGATAGGTLELDTVGTRGNALTLRGRTDTTYDVNNIAGSNTLNGVVTLADSTTASNTPDNYNFNVAGGDITITNGVTATETDGTEVNLNLSGAALTNGYMGAVDLTAATGSANDINKSGGGKWWLNGATSGVTDINVSGGTLMLNHGDITLGGSVNLATGGTLAQNIDNAFNGKDIQMSGGTLNLNGHDAILDGLHGDGVVTSVDDPGLTLIGGGTYSGTITGPIDLTMNGASTAVQILSGTGTNTYSGVTTISGGTLQVEKDSALGTPVGGQTLANGTVINGTGVLGLNGVSSGEYLTVAGRDAGDANPNAVVSTGSNTLSGPIALTATDATGTDFAFSSASGTLTVDGAITGDGSNALIFRGAGDTVVSGSITLTEAGSDHMVVGDEGGAKTIAGAVDLSGSGSAAIINAGTGSMTFNAPVKMNDVTGAAWVRANGGDLSVTGTLDMKNAAGAATIANYGAGAVAVAGADMSGAQGNASVWNDAAGSLTVGSVAVAGVLNMSGAQGSWSQVVNAGAGSVIVYSDIDMTGSTAANNVVGNRGAGSLVANGDIDMTGSTGVRQVGNVGTGSTTVDGTLTNVAEAGASAGTFIVGSAANLAGVGKLGVSDGATIDATAVASDFNIVSGQTLYGAGTVKEPTAGDVVAKAGSTIDIGNGLYTDIATLTILGDMTLEEDSLIQINLDPTGAGLVDLLQVSDILNIVDRAKLVFYWTVAPTALVYEFARYETLDPTSGTFAVTNAPTGYHIDYGYNGHYVALVSDIPVPAPLFLMGLGALIMGAGRRYAKW